MSLCTAADVPLFDRTPHRSSVPTKHANAAARRVGPGRPSGRRASASPWTDASTAARSACGGTVVGVAALALALMTAAVDEAMAEGVQPAGHAAVMAMEGEHAVLIAEAAQRFGLPARWIRLVMQAESAGVVRATSPAGAMGLMQLMPDTYAVMRARYGLGQDPYDPRNNILAGAALLRELFDRYGTPGFLAAYNAGPARYEQHVTHGWPLPAETRAFVATLAPAIGSTPPDDAPSAAMDAPAPEEAPIFVVRRGGPRTGASTPTADAIDPESNGLFAGRRPVEHEPPDVGAGAARPVDLRAGGPRSVARTDVAMPDTRLFVTTTDKRKQQ